MMRYPACLVAIAALMASMPALAHPGSHHGMAPGDFLHHLATGWHLVLIVGAGAIGLSFVALMRRRAARLSRARRRAGNEA